MMNIVENHSLQALNTFGVAVKSRFFVELSDVADLQEIKKLPKPTLFLGGGSNVLFTKDYLGTTIHNKLQGISEIGRASCREREYICVVAIDMKRNKDDGQSGHIAR